MLIPHESFPLQKVATASSEVKPTITVTIQDMTTGSRPSFMRAITPVADTQGKSTCRAIYNPRVGLKIHSQRSAHALSYPPE